MRKLLATKNTIIVKKIEYNKSTSTLIVPEKTDVHIGKIESVAAGSEFKEGEIVIFPASCGFTTTIDRIQYVILSHDNILGKIVQDEARTKTLPSVDIHPEYVQNATAKWTNVFGSLYDNMLIDKEIISCLLENQNKMFKSDFDLSISSTEALSKLVFSAIINIFRDNCLVQAAEKPAFNFVGDSNFKQNLVSTKNLVTKIKLSDLNQGNFQSAIDGLKKEIDALGECVIYTPLIPMLISDFYSNEETKYAFAIRYWRPHCPSAQ